jgi:hypothetical protein
LWFSIFLFNKSAWLVKKSGLIYSNSLFWISVLYCKNITGHFLLLVSTNLENLRFSLSKNNNLITFYYICSVKRVGI